MFPHASVFYSDAFHLANARKRPCLWTIRWSFLFITWLLGDGLEQFNVDDLEQFIILNDAIKYNGSQNCRC